MHVENIVGDIISVIAAVIAFCYVLGIWRMVHARSRLMLLMAMLYMVVTRCVILATEASTSTNWIIEHRSLVSIPQYIFFAIAFGMTYYELRNFHFEVPKSNEDLDTQAKHLRYMESLRRDTIPTSSTTKYTDLLKPDDSKEQNL